MGVNMAGYCIVDNDYCKAASQQEIIRRFYQAQCDARKGRVSKDVVSKIELLMRKLAVSTNDRKCVAAALNKEADTNAPAVAIELKDGRIVTGKTGKLLGPSAACLLNALKTLGNIDDKIELISPTIIAPLQKLKVNHMGATNPRLHTDEVLMALSICAVNDPKAKKAVSQLDKLKNCEIHSSVMLAHVDERTFKTLGMHLTCEPQRQVIVTEQA